MGKIIFTQKQMQDMVARYANEETCVSIGQKHNVSAKVVKRVLREQGVELRSKRKHFYDEHIFDEIDSAEKAYWIGFIAADGYINENRHFLSIKLQGSDREHLLKFIRFIGGDEGMLKTECHNITGNELCKVDVNGVYFTNSLVKLNLRQGKSSGKEQLSPIPQEYIKDYIRGLWDGDGHLNEKCLNLISSVEILEFVQNYLHDTCDTTIGKITDHCSTYRIFISKNRKSALEHLYYDNCVALDRKYNTSIEIINALNEKERIKEQRANNKNNKS